MITDNGVPAVRTVRFNGTFRAANESRARYRVFCGGAGSGKKGQSGKGGKDGRIKDIYSWVPSQVE